MALWNNFPYVNTQELNLDYLIKKMKELEAQWKAIAGQVTATAERGNQVAVTVDGDLKNGLNFDFTLPSGSVATSTQVGEVKPDNSSIFVGDDGTISTQLTSLAVKQSSGAASLEANEFTKITLNRTEASTGDVDALTLSEDGGILVNIDGTYLIEGCSWVVPDSLEDAVDAQLRIRINDTPISWGIVDFNNDENGLPLNTAMRLTNVYAGQVIYMDVAIAGTTGSYKYANRETQLTVIRVGNLMLS